MLSDREDVRGRQTDQRLCDPRLLQSINAGEMPLASQPQAQVDAARRAVHPYAALASRCALHSVAAVELGHVEFLLCPLLGLLQPKILPGQPRPAPALRYLVQGANGDAYADYIRWRASTVPGAPQPNGWWFAPGAAGQQSPGLGVIDGGAGPLDLTAMEGAVRRVRSDDGGRGCVDLVVADGVDAHAGPSGSLEKQLYAVVMSQAAVALQVLREGGCFVFRAVEATTPLSAEILFLVQACFEHTSIVRSFASRPTGADRFVVCRGLVAGVKDVASHLLAALATIRDGQFKLAHLVSWTRVSAEKDFVNMVCAANMSVAKAQITALAAVAARAQEQHAAGDGFSGAQIDLATRCLRLWGLPTTDTAL
ncbi:Cap-specific mRNA (nucleoside-2'-O-)-methyltransferase 1 [Coemansia spiralis]|nr:Cap-specific mRNA (nucleoside-2'-O-)-methyltransferase 1 [Coemansia spiralis]